MQSKGMTLGGRIASGLAVLALVASAAMKLSHNPKMVENIGKFGFQPDQLTALGLIELTCALVYAIPQTALLGAILVTGYFGGAICTHFRMGDVFIAPLALALVAWLGLWLREPRLRAILPLRR